MPTTRNVKTFAILIAFQDYPFSNTQAYIDSILFGTGEPSHFPYESLAAYYSRSSYNQLNLSDGNTLGWYTTAYNRSEVPETTAGRENLIKEVLDYYDAQGHDFAQYDNDGDGDIDYLIVIWTGPSGDWATFWWGYYTGFSDFTYTLDGKTLSTYSWQWESNYPTTVIHETGHALGLPDYYDYDNTVGLDGGVGGLDMMDAAKGDHNCFSKWMLDWITPVFVSSGSTNLALEASGQSEDAVMIISGANSDGLFSEYFMVQNRHRVGNDNTYMPGDGMLIWHIDARLTLWGGFLYNNSYTEHKLLRL